MIVDEYATVHDESVVDMTEANRQNSWHRECNLVSTWAALAVNTYRSTDDYREANSRHLFVTSVSRVFEMMRLRIAVGPLNVLEEYVNESITQLADVLSRMVDALRWSLVNSKRDCGAYMPLPWVKDILQCYEAAQKAGWPRCEHPLQDIPLTGDDTMRPTFLLTLRLLDACLECGLLTGETSEDDFDKLLLILEEPTLPGLPLDLLETAAVRGAPHIETAEGPAVRRVARQAEQKAREIREAREAAREAAAACLECYKRKKEVRVIK